jgi:membrane fusion protein, multidrug efflux system
MEVYRQNHGVDPKPPPQPQQQDAPPRETHASPVEDSGKTLKERARGLLHNRKFMRIAIPVAIVVGVLLGYWIFNFIVFESTDDAYITADLHVISPHINGKVIEVLVIDNQIVKRGDVLVRLDPRDYDVQLKIAEANLLKSQNDFSRWAKTTRLDPDERLLYDADQAALLTAQANIENARLQMEYTNITAPEDGKIGARSVTTGEQLQVGQELMALVDLRMWVVANYKEGQLKKIRVGQRATIKVDAIEGHTFTGHVDSVSPGSGATFSLLPPDNATGNFTKIVQRVPVKIVFDADSVKGYEDRLTAGMSVESHIRVHW